MHNLLGERTPEQRKQDLEKANMLRIERTEMLRGLRQGTILLDDIFDKVHNGDKAAGGLRVRAVLMSYPRVGPVTADKTLEDLKISPRRRLRGVGRKQEERLLMWSSQQVGKSFF